MQPLPLSGAQGGVAAHSLGFLKGGRGPEPARMSRFSLTALLGSGPQGLGTEVITGGPETSPFAISSLWCFWGP